MSRDFIVIALLIAVVLPFWVKVVNLQTDIDNAPDAELARHLRRYSSKLTMAIVATIVCGGLALAYHVSDRAGAFSEIADR